MIISWKKIEKVAKLIKWIWSKAEAIYLAVKGAVK